MAVNVCVKWGQQKMEVDVDTNDDPITFKSQLFALTGVEPARQKVLFKGKTLKDESWEGFPSLSPGSQLMLMGSAAPLPSAPKEKTVFIEDMSESELAQKMDIPAGLKNLGNTCYLNATLQCLKSIPELRDALKTTPGQALNLSAGPEAITASIRDLYSQMDKSKEVVPLVMVQVLHMIFPRFAEKDDHGNWSQQDANECWVELVRLLQQKVKGRTEEDEEGGQGGGRSIIDDYLRGTFDVSLKCVEDEEEPESKTVEDFFTLSCFLSQEVKYLHSGLMGRLTEEIEKRNEKLDRNAKYTKSSRVSRLPGYLTIQMIRFFFKEKDAINAKILKDVKFPMELDVFELCTPELKAKLQPMRDRFKVEDDRTAEEMRVQKMSLKGAPTNDKKESKEEEGTMVPWCFPDDPGSNNSGYYTLQAVLTHKGRSSNSGHYVAWVKRATGDWIKCDDDVVTPVSEEEILKLSGGGDWHCAYILLYGPRILRERPPAKATEPAATTDPTATSPTSMDTQ